MLTGSIYGWENGGDDIFDPQSSRNRDNCLEPMRVLNSLARKNEIFLHTADLNDISRVRPDFSLYVESIDFVPGKAQKNYLILYETPLTVPRNADFDYLKQFDGIFTWDAELLARGFWRGAKSIPQNRFIQIRYPNPVPMECGPDFHSPSFEQRKEFACLIGSNRHANCDDPRELYSERVRAIRWFEKHAKDKLKLYGNGWIVPPKKFGRIGKFRYRLEKIAPWLLGRPVFPSYQGPTKTKFEVLSRAKFCICFENARDIPGYITEKIFDCFFAGCVPVYWGDHDIEKYIPSECFINFREFPSYEDLYKFVDNIGPEQYLAYQIAIKKFLMSPNFTPFSSKRFAETIIQKIMQDFESL
jgi:hypothetical protein